MLAYTLFEEDTRVMRYAETLAQRGDSVDVVSLRKGGLPLTDMINGVRVIRIQKRSLNEKGRLSYLIRLAKFFFASAVTVTINHLRNPYHLIHVHSVPDFEVFAALVPKLAGAKIILDIHDIVLEFYASKFNASHRSWLFKVLYIAS